MPLTLTQSPQVTQTVTANHRSLANQQNVNVVHSQVDVQIEDDDEVADEPIVSGSDVNIVMSTDAVFNTVCETKDEERTRVK